MGERTDLGTRRLRVLLGLIGAALWLVFAGYQVFIYDLPWDFLAIFGIGGALAAFGTTFVLVRGVAWVVRGYRGND